MTDYSCNISKFYERDIDIMLAEELRVNPDFSRWFVNQGGGGFECKHPAEWVDVSVVEDGSEADVVALFCDNSGKKYKLFIENKIDHTKGERQLERYIRRAQNELKRGEISDWSIKFFTPAAYSDRNCPDGVQNITFENAADFLKESSNDARGAYKASFLSEAAIIRNQKERDNHTTETAPFVKEWWDAVYKKLEEEERFLTILYTKPNIQGRFTLLLQLMALPKVSFVLISKDTKAKWILLLWTAIVIGY